MLDYPQRCHIYDIMLKLPFAQKETRLSVCSKELDQLSHFLFWFLVRGKESQQPFVFGMIFWRWRSDFRGRKKCVRLEKCELWPQKSGCANIIPTSLFLEIGKTLVPLTSPTGSKGFEKQVKTSKNVKDFKTYDKDFKISNKDFKNSNKGFKSW